MTSERVVVGYCRKSKGDDLQTQIEDVQLLARQRGLKLTHIYRDESISAAELHGRRAKGRPGFEALMAAVRRGEISHILVRATDRLIRGRRQRVDVYEALAAHSVSLLVLKGVDVDLTSASGRLVAGVLAEVAAHEVEIQSERTQRALRRRLEEGLPATADRTFGFTADGMSLVEAEAAAVRDVFAAFLVGGSLSGIARMLNQRGLKTRGGRQHTAGTTRHMLRNLRYAAVREDGDGKVWPLKSPKIVDESQVRAARAMLADPSRRSSTSNASRWALSSIGDCGACNASKVTSGSRGRSKVSGEPVPIYRCPSCRKLGRSAQPVDDYLRALVAAVIERDADELMAPTAEDPAVQEARSAVAAGRLRLEQLADLVADGALDPAAYASAVARVNGRVRAAQEVLDSHYQDAALAGVVDADDVRAAVDALPLDRFRHVLGVLFESVTLLPAAGLPKTLGFQPSSVVAVLKSGKPKPPVEGETVTLTLGSHATARGLADSLRSGGFPVQLKRGGRLVVPADAAAVTQQWKADWDLGFTYDLDPQSAVAAAVRRIAAGAPELTDEQREAVRAALA
jgi:DNA invertase Pin-like site-specific DNA recombinase